MDGEVTKIKMKEKKPFVLPEGAVVNSKEVSMIAEQITNGYILRTCTDIKYTDAAGQSHYEYITEKTFFKNNPIKLQVPKSKKKPEGKTVSLAEQFE